MQINSYSFGKIVIEGQKYTNDIILYPDKIKDSWWRKEGHKLHLEDLEEVIYFSPDHLLIGTGNSGLMKVPKDIITHLNNKGIKVTVKKTDQIVKEYNQKNHLKNTVAALHLTC